MRVPHSSTWELFQTQWEIEKTESNVLLWYGMAVLGAKKEANIAG